MKDITVFGFLGTVMDRISHRKGKFEKRWDKWRPTISVCQKTSQFQVNTFYLIYQKEEEKLLEEVIADIKTVSLKTKVQPVALEFKNPWDLAEVYLTLYNYFDSFQFKPENRRYYFHITTGSHIQQIVSFLLTEARIFPGKLLQTAPPDKDLGGLPRHQLIDLDLSKFDKLNERFARRRDDATSFLKSGIATRNPAFNKLIDQIELVAVKTAAPMLITGPTGAGKSHLVSRLYELKLQRGLVEGKFVEVNCATLRGDNAMSTLFGHNKGAFTGANTAREGLLKRAHKGLLFLDEIGELGLDEQAMLLKAIEEKRFLPMGADEEVVSDFQLIAGTNRDLRKEVRTGKFREDLFARINLWTYQLPALKDRMEDFEPNLDYELERFEINYGTRVRFNSEAREAYLNFAKLPASCWSGNFRDLNASITRMATLADTGRIDKDITEDEIGKLRYLWEDSDTETRQASKVNLSDFLSDEYIADIDDFDLPQLEHVIHVCQQSRSAAEAGRRLFNVSREQKKSSNDTSRLAKYLGRFGLQFQDLNKSV